MRTVPEQLREAERVARKVHHCEMCTAMIRVGERHHVSTNVFDGRVYDWRTCAACRADGIVIEVYDWAGMPDEGVDQESAREWAHDAVQAGPGHPKIVAMAKAYLRRCGCRCERCDQAGGEGR